MKSITLSRTVAASLAVVSTTLALASYDQTPANWTYKNDQNLAGIGAMSKDGWRAVSFSYNRLVGNEIRYNVCYVSNIGSTYKGWFFAEGQTADSLRTNYPGLRMIDIAYVVKNNVGCYSALFIPNSGADKRDTYFRTFGDWNTIMTEARNKGYKPASLDSTLYGGNKWHVVFTKNEGMADEVGWWAYDKVDSFATIGARMQQKNAVATVVDEGVVLETRRPTDRMGLFVGTSQAAVNAAADREGLRVQSMNASGSAWRGVLVSNLNPESARITDMMLAQTDGKVGIMLRPKGAGSGTIWHRHNTSFYPSSTMKIFLAFHAIANVNNPNSFSLPVWANDISDDHSNDSSVMTPLNQVIKPMLTVSSNKMANAVIDFWGRTSINNFLAFMSIPNTQVVNKLGTGPYTAGSKTFTTLDDLGRCYDRIHTDTTFSVSRRTFLYNNAFSNLTGGNQWNSVIDDEAAKLGISASNKSAFKLGMQWLWKDGSNGVPNVAPAVNGYYSRAGYVSLPIKNGAAREFVFGYYAVEAQAKNTVGSWVSGELLRAEIRKALATFK